MCGLNGASIAQGREGRHGGVGGRGRAPDLSDGPGVSDKPDGADGRAYTASQVKDL